MRSNAKHLPSHLHRHLTQPPPAAALLDWMDCLVPAVLLLPAAKWQGSAQAEKVLLLLLHKSLQVHS